ncbi:molybdate ABC transporter substrate-binding protein [Natronospirillum operosum]|uniref:Molybdate ABC transporter substrate-binding protein n=1 Tax=Natronospirillum operosum TaxID=2759953 RepID=A0A4Z0WGE5_9GAMM|nr:molybdate ABC transporter substrate-binding protein [Natronospirillum operosum]
MAANFNPTLEHLVTQYQSQHPDFRVRISSGSSGKHFAQIRQGAPFDLFFSADDQRTADLVDSGEALPDSRLVYALGQLMLWSNDPELIPEDGLALLQSGEFRRLAIANPRVAPYGVAAEALLDNAGVQLQSRQLVTGQSISQAFTFVRSGNAELGLVAASQVIVLERQQGGEPMGSRWLPPADSYPPIVQEAVMLQAGADNPWAAAFMQWVRCDQVAHGILEQDGYLLPSRNGEAGCAGY